jgi:hypothetical protein
VTKLDGELDPLRQPLQEGLQRWALGRREVGRQLHQDHAQPPLQKLRTLAEGLQHLIATSQPPLVRQLAR